MKFSFQTTSKQENMLTVIMFLCFIPIAILSFITNNIDIAKLNPKMPQLYLDIINWIWIIIAILFIRTVIKRGRKIMRSKEYQDMLIENKQNEPKQLTPEEEKKRYGL
ncbi:MAG: hypothetical protein LBI13_03415 [Streptococcaceae bacterium]|jgi:hypothetical protein|nr:hypothetical protein [Streptococcaceae bacterium]